MFLLKDKWENLVLINPDRIAQSDKVAAERKFVEVFISIPLNKLPECDI